jgi:hypothetical protein
VKTLMPDFCGIEILIVDYLSRKQKNAKWVFPRKQGETPITFRVEDLGWLAKQAKIGNYCSM